MSKHVRGALLLAMLGLIPVGFSATPASAQLFSRGCKNCQRPVTHCNCQSHQAVIDTEMVPQQVTTYRNEVTTQYRQEAVADRPRHDVSRCRRRRRKLPNRLRSQTSHQADSSSLLSAADRVSQRAGSSDSTSAAGLDANGSAAGRAESDILVPNNPGGSHCSDERAGLYGICSAGAGSCRTVWWTGVRGRSDLSECLNNRSSSDRRKSGDDTATYLERVDLDCIGHAFAFDTGAGSQVSR